MNTAERFAGAADAILDLVGRLRVRHCPYTPTPGQEAFLRLRTPQVLYGGVAGGGKTIALLMAAAQYTDVPGYDALLVRATIGEFELPGGLISISHDWFGTTKAVWNGEQRKWRFPGKTRSGAGGATMTFGYLDSARDASRYSGSGFSFLGIDELSRVDEASYRRMFRVLRRSANSNADAAPDGTTLADVPVRIRATSNPGGPNHNWIKAYFVDPTSRPDGVLYLPARWNDNPHVDPDDYATWLTHYPPAERLRLMNGDWDVPDEGDMFRRDWFELIEPHQVPKNTRAVRYWEFASTEPSLANPDPDWTVGLRLAIDDSSGIYYITGIVRQRVHAGRVEQLVRATAQADGIGVRVFIEQEPAGSGVAVVSRYKRDVLRGYRVQGDRPTGRKEVRAQVVAAVAENGDIKLVRGPHWQEFLDEVAAFPDSAHDDCVDALAGAHKALGGVRSGRSGIHVPQGSIWDVANASRRRQPLSMTINTRHREEQRMSELASRLGVPYIPGR